MTAGENCRGHEHLCAVKGFEAQAGPLLRNVMSEAARTDSGDSRSFFLMQAR